MNASITAASSCWAETLRLLTPFVPGCTNEAAECKHRRHVVLYNQAKRVSHTTDSKYNIFTRSCNVMHLSVVDGEHNNTKPNNRNSIMLFWDMLLPLGRLRAILFWDIPQGLPACEVEPQAEATSPSPAHSMAISTKCHRFLPCPIPCLLKKVLHTLADWISHDLEHYQALARGKYWCGCGRP